MRTNRATLESSISVLSTVIPSSGYAGLDIHDNQIDIYSWKENGNYVGTVGSTYNSSTRVHSIGLYADYGDEAFIGYLPSSGSSSISRAISVKDGAVNIFKPTTISAATTISGATTFNNDVTFNYTEYIKWLKIWNSGSSAWASPISTTITIGGKTLTFVQGLLVSVS